MRNTKIKIRTALAGLLIVFLMTVQNLQAQSRFVVNGGIGHTSVDLETWSGYDDLYDWNEMMSEGYVQVLFYNRGNLHAGLEAGHQYFFWYTYKQSDGYYNLTYEREVSCWRIAAVAQTKMNEKVFAEFGLGHYMFENFSDFGLMGALGYSIAINEKLSVPVKFRTSIVLDNATNLTVFGLSLGLAYKP